MLRTAKFVDILEIRIFFSIFFFVIFPFVEVFTKVFIFQLPFEAIVYA